MTLVEIRERLIIATGRTDLVVDTTNYADDGADWYIQAGQRFLDDELPTPKSLAEVEKTISAGDASVSFPNIRAIETVRLQESGEQPSFLDRVPLREFYNRFGDLTYLQNQAEQDKPTRYALGIHRDGSASATELSERLIVFHPRADKEYTLVITTAYFSTPLEQDSDESWWSLQYPEVLVLAARRAIEIDHRNRQGVQEFERQIQKRVQQIDSNLVQEDSFNKGQMNNAW